ncbi:NAD+ synthase [Zooshikella harenae]|uniref:Glutamine-dependent NAD(+) synthetase n=1 Tax=Zooshikella harenae TaxID=2827238 RepID=A0ABS5ZAD6_9GAMM|nr:NAD+ synthase [Zooshikella harenae]MBU2711021.1 NAD+ synthase [Zooshikella harenae]
MKVTLAQLNYRIGDLAGNCNKISEVIQQQGNQTDLIIFSELCITGYYPLDLLDKPEFIANQDEHIERIKKLSEQYSAGIIIGVVDRNAFTGKPYHNALMLIEKGNCRFIYHKQLLPTYNIFSEARHFEPGKIPGVCLFRGHRLGFLICEDGWNDQAPFHYDNNPVQDLAREKPDLVISLNSSPSNTGKQEERVLRFTHIAKHCQAPLIYVNQTGANDDIVYDGASFVCDEKGQGVLQLPAFEEHVTTITVLSPDAKKSPSVTLLAMDNIALYYQQLIMGIRDYVAKCGFPGIVIGSSGGIDSALTLALAKQAIGAEKVTAITMPSRFSSEGSRHDSEALCYNLGVKLYTYSIDDEFASSLQSFSGVFKEPARGITAENIQARIRGRVLMEYSNQTGYLVLSTGNKSELSVGYATLYGDMCGGLNVLGDLYKTQVYALANYYNELHPAAVIPQEIIDKAPSAELAEDQKDSDSLPDYPVLDAILQQYIEGDLISEHERQQASAILQRVSTEVIAEVKKLVDRTEFKRRQAPPIIRVQRRSFGAGRQLPISGSYEYC